MPCYKIGMFLLGSGGLRLGYVSHLSGKTNMIHHGNRIFNNLEVHLSLNIKHVLFLADVFAFREFDWGPHKIHCCTILLLVITH